VTVNALHLYVTFSCIYI